MEGTTRERSLRPGKLPPGWRCSSPTIKIVSLSRFLAQDLERNGLAHMAAAEEGERAGGVPQQTSRLTHKEGQKTASEHVGQEQSSAVHRKALAGQSVD